MMRTIYDEFTHTMMQSHQRVEEHDATRCAAASGSATLTAPPTGGISLESGPHVTPWIQPG